MPERRGPANEIIPRSKMPCCGTECKASKRPVFAKGHVLEMFADRLRIAEVMVFLDKAVEKLFQRASSDLPDGDGEKLPQRFFHRCRVDVDLFRPASVRQRIFWDLLAGRQTNGALTFQSQ